MRISSRSLGFGSFFICLLFSACQVGDLGNDSAGTGGDDDDGGDEPACEGPLGPARDPASLPACCTDFVGGSHCLPGETVPAEVQAFLGPCDGGGFCVPDKFIATGGLYTPKACASIGGAAGVCLSGCIPQVYDNYGLLPPDTCDADEKCVPCINPLDDTVTGACDFAFTCEADPADDGGDPVPPPSPSCPHEGPPVIEPSTLPACNLCGGAHCVPNDLVPADFASRLSACDGTFTSKCVPDEFIASGGDIIPASCDSLAGAEGRCLSRCLPEVRDQEALLPQDTCPTTHLCVPCFNPLDGVETGACGLSCDPGPTEPAAVLPTCCDGLGTCVPAAAAGDQADKLGEDECPEDTGLLCAPNVFIEGTFVPEDCETGLIATLFGDEFKPGACLPECLPDVDTFLIGQDGCPDNFKCAPCLNPLSGEPSGACDL